MSVLSLPRLGARTELFVGRELELDELSNQLKFALSGRPNAVMICGDPGVGKTRLLREFAAIARRGGDQAKLRVLRGRALEESWTPYLPFTAVFDACSDLGLEDTVSSAGVARLQEVSRIASGSGDDVGYEQIRLFVSVVRQIVALSRREPLLILLDDLHWADAASLDLLGQLVFLLADGEVDSRPNVMIVGTYRPVSQTHRLGKLMSRLKHESMVTSMDLSGLTDAETDSLLRGLGLQRAEDRLVRTVQRVTHGYPLFIHELVHHMNTNGMLVETAGYTTVRGRGAEIALPRDVGSSLTARLDSLSSHQLEVLTLASLLGDDFTLERLASTAGLAVEPLLTALGGAIENQILVLEDHGYRFRHPLVRQTLLNMAQPARKALYHLKIADTLEREPSTGAMSIEIANHLIAARPHTDAGRLFEHARRGAAHAFSICAWGESARLYTCASEIVPDTTDRHRQIGELQLLAAKAWYQDSDIEACLRCCESALETFEQCGHLHGTADALSCKALALCVGSQISYGDTLDLSPHERVLTQLDQSAPRVRGMLLEAMSRMYWTARQAAPAQDMARRALALGEQIEDDELRHRAQFALGLALFQCAEFQASYDSYMKSLEYGRRCYNPWAQVRPLQRLAAMHIVFGRLSQAQRCTVDGITEAQRVGYRAEEAFAMANRAALALARGQLDRVQADAHQALVLARRAHYPWAGLIALTSLAWARSLEGRHADALFAIRLITKPGELYDVPGGSIAYLVTLWEDVLMAQEKPLRHAPERVTYHAAMVMTLPELDANGAGALCAIALLAATLGITAPEVIEPVYGRVLALAQRGMQFTVAPTLCVARVLGVASMLQGRTDLAELHFQQAIALCAASGTRIEQAISHLNLAELLFASGRESEGATHAVLAADFFTRLQLSALARRATTRTCAPESDSSQEGPVVLSQQEMDLLRSMALGRSYAEFAHEQLVDASSVALLAEALFKKIDVSGPALAAAYAFEHGLVGGAPSTAGQSVLMVTDMVDFTHLVERMGDLHARTLTHVHNRILRQQLAKHRGKEVAHTGDGLMASFASGDDAVACATGIQRELDAYVKANPGAPISVRIGLNAGHVLPEEDRLFGAALIAAVRICGHAQSRQILLSESVLQITEETVRLRVVSLGSMALKGFKEPARVYEFLWNQ